MPRPGKEAPVFVPLWRPNPLQLESLEKQFFVCVFFVASLKGRRCFVALVWPRGCKQKSARSLWESVFSSHCLEPAVVSGAAAAMP